MSSETHEQPAERERMRDYEEETFGVSAEREREWLSFQDWMDIDAPQTCADEWKAIIKRITDKYGTPAEFEQRIREDERRECVREASADDITIVRLSHLKSLKQRVREFDKAMLETNERFLTSQRRVRELEAFLHKIDGLIESQGSYVLQKEYYALKKGDHQ